MFVISYVISLNNCAVGPFNPPPPLPPLPTTTILILLLPQLLHVPLLPILQLLLLLLVLLRYSSLKPLFSTNARGCKSVVTNLIMQAPILLFLLKLPGLHLITCSCSGNGELLCCTVMHTQTLHAVLEVEATGGLGSWTGSKYFIDSDAHAMGSATGPCVFRCKSGVHVVNGVYRIDTGLSCFSSQAANSNGCLRRRY